MGGVAGGLRQPRPQSSSAISDVTSPFKLVDRARFQASPGNSDSANWPGFEAGTEIFKKILTGSPLLSSRRFLLPRSFAARPTALTESLVLAETKAFLSAGTDLTVLSCKFCDVLSTKNSHSAIIADLMKLLKLMIIDYSTTNSCKMKYSYFLASVLWCVTLPDTIYRPTFLFVAFFSFRCTDYSRFTKSTVVCTTELSKTKSAVLKTKRTFTGCNTVINPLQ